jgi:PAS domain S-box-containing protein
MKKYMNNLQKYKKTGDCEVVGRTRNVSAQRKDGTVIPVELLVTSINIQGKWHAVGTIREIKR